MKGKYFQRFCVLCLLHSLIALSTLNAQTCELTSPCTPLKGGQTFDEPFEVGTTNGFLSTSLVVDIGTKTIDWLSVKRRLYNGTFPGPTIRVRAGDKVNLNLVNNLQEEDYNSGEEDVLQFPNTTNLHTHGLHISSVVPQDNVFIDINQTESFQYMYEIDPEQPAGTYWYHPHKHGAGFFQISGGMSGMLVVEDDPSTMSPELDAISCPNHCENDLNMVFQMFQYSSVEEGGFADAQIEIHDDETFRLNNILVNNSSETLEDWLATPSNNISYFLINGQLQPIISIRSGEAKRFRLLSAGGLYALALRIVNSNSSVEDACTVQEIALDGVYLDEPRDIRLGRSLIVAGSRIDWAVKCPTAGTYELQSYFTNEDTRSMGDHPMFTGILATINVTDGSGDSPLPTVLPSLPSFLKDFRTVEEKEIGGRFAIEVTPTDTINRENFEENYIRYKMEVDTVQELYFTNTEYQTSHPIHMHINTFQVISYNKYTGPYGLDDGGNNWTLYSQNGSVCEYQHSYYDANAKMEHPSNPLEYLGHEMVQDEGGNGTLGYAQIGERRDTLLVPPLSNVTVRFMAAKYVGEVVIHCHLLKDSDQGMLMTVEVVEKGESLDANVTSAGAYPWSCFENNPIGYSIGGGASMAISSVWVLFLCLLSTTGLCSQLLTVKY